MGESTEFGAELTDFRSRVEELKSARSLPPEDRMAALDTALFELQHAADVLLPRYEELATAGRGGARREDPEVRLLRGLFQRLPLPVALTDRSTVVRRINVAAAEIFGMQAGYATGRALTGALSHDSRAAFRSQVAAVARGEGARSLVVRRLGESGLPGAAGGALRATLTALRPPDEQRPAVLVVFQPIASSEAERETARPPAPGRRTAPVRFPRPELAEVTRHAELMDLVDDMAAGLLSVPEGDTKAVLDVAAGLLHERFADWVIADLADGGGAGGGPGAAGPARLRRAVVLGSAPGSAAGLAALDPSDAPLVVEAVRDGVSALRVRPEDPDAFGRDASGAAVLVSARVTSLICVPLSAPGGAADGGGPGRAAPPVLGALTLLRTGGRRAFEMAEAGAVNRMSRHLALALRRPAARP
ncbi:PAS domain-containing protein [Streptomyces sp. Ru87]|uniref:PAS domain-containing protein n=1 Tax=Streptomyces sp. Ru87 TaxID=2044307 RepID=UPI000BF3B86D|nr:PAS domain-containing protein [Streptomyces sp. Ru87]PGH47814.1 diguanylate cyclase [Streptomyces sp. Ru87]